MSKFKGIGINPELPIVLTITILLLLGGLGVIYAGDKQEFNFYSSTITVNGVNIQEELNYKANKDYHTLYRNFLNPLYWDDSSEIYDSNYIFVSNVGCSFGTGYIRDSLGKCYNFDENFNCLPYTENNEYGCTFGNVLGFSKGEKYTLNADYEIHPENLFLINGKYYIKFVAYGQNNHVKLNKKNFIVEGEVVKKEKYFPNENALIYITYKGDISSFNIIELDDFEFDSRFSFLRDYFLLIFFSLFPGIFFFLVWFFVGKEKTYENIPKELSDFPTKRKAWEIAAYFNPPFFKIDKNFFSSTLLNFYNQKVIDIKEKDKEIYIKLNNFKGDETEKKVYEILKEVEKNAKSDILEGGYFNLKNSMVNSSNLVTYKKFTKLGEDIKKEGKKYLNENKDLMIVISSLFIVFLFISIKFNVGAMILLYIWTFLIMFILSLTGAIFTRFKGEYYVEYQKWKAFKRYLKNSFSIKTATHKTVVIWNEYLVYATALGVPDKVIKELKSYNLITDKQMNLYNGVILTSSFAFSTSSGGGMSGGGFSGGGFGGAGGGGVGGGGGGGR